MFGGSNTYSLGIWMSRVIYIYRLKVHKSLPISDLPILLTTLYMRSHTVTKPFTVPPFPLKGHRTKSLRFRRAVSWVVCFSDRPGWEVRFDIIPTWSTVPFMGFFGWFLRSGHCDFIYNLYHFSQFTSNNMAEICGIHDWMMYNLSHVDVC